MRTGSADVEQNHATYALFLGNVLDKVKLRCEIIGREYPYAQLINHLNAYAARAHSDIIQGPWYKGELIPGQTWRNFATIDINNRIHDGGEPSVLVNEVWPVAVRDGHQTKFVLKTDDGESFSVWKGTGGYYLRPDRETPEEVRELLEIKMSHATMKVRCADFSPDKPDVAAGTNDGSSEDMQETEGPLPRERPNPTGGVGEGEDMQEDIPSLTHSHSASPSSSSDDEDTYVEINNISTGGQDAAISSGHNGEGAEANDKRK